MARGCLNTENTRVGGYSGPPTGKLKRAGRIGGLKNEIEGGGVVGSFLGFSTASLGNHYIVVATDDNRISSVLEAHNVPFVMTQKAHESGTDRAAEVARQMNWLEDDIIVNVQGDEPLIPVDLLQAFADFCCERKGLKMASIAVPLSDHAQLGDSNIVKVVFDRHDDALMFSRSPIPFCRDRSPDDWPLHEFSRHVGIYAYRNAVLQRLTETPACQLETLEKLEQLRALWLGIKISMMRWHAMPPHGVDTPEDAQRITDILLKEQL